MTQKKSLLSHNSSQTLKLMESICKFCRSNQKRGKSTSTSTIAVNLRANITYNFSLRLHSAISFDLEWEDRRCSRCTCNNVRCPFTFIFLMVQLASLLIFFWIVDHDIDKIRVFTNLASSSADAKMRRAPWNQNPRKITFTITNSLQSAVHATVDVSLWLKSKFKIA